MAMESIIKGSHKATLAYKSYASSTIDTTSTSGHLLAGTYVCDKCPAKSARAFPSAEALAAHSLQAHNESRLASMYIDEDNKCPICDKDFFKKCLVATHLHRTFKCSSAMADGQCQPIGLDVLKRVEPRCWNNFMQFYET